jgi:hypothetical protein
VTRRPRWRFWVETGLATASAVLFVASLVFPTWIEAVLRVDPDSGSGSFEWLIVAAFATATVVSALVARRELRRTALTISTAS